MDMYDFVYKVIDGLSPTQDVNSELWQKKLLDITQLLKRYQAKGVDLKKISFIKYFVEKLEKNNKLQNYQLVRKLVVNLHAELLFHYQITLLSKRSRQFIDSAAGQHLAVLVQSLKMTFHRFVAKSELGDEEMVVLHASLDVLLKLNHALSTNMPMLPAAACALEAVFRQLNYAEASKVARVKLALDKAMEKVNAPVTENYDTLQANAWQTLEKAERTISGAAELSQSLINDKRLIFDSYAEALQFVILNIAENIPLSIERFHQNYYLLELYCQKANSAAKVLASLEHIRSHFIAENALILRTNISTAVLSRYFQLLIQLKNNNIRDTQTHIEGTCLQLLQLFYNELRKMPVEQFTDEVLQKLRRVFKKFDDQYAQAFSHNSDIIELCLQIQTLLKGRHISFSRRIKEWQASALTENNLPTDVFFKRRLQGKSLLIRAEILRAQLSALVNRAALNHEICPRELLEVTQSIFTMTKCSVGKLYQRIYRDGKNSLVAKRHCHFHLIATQLQQALEAIIQQFTCKVITETTFNQLLCHIEKYIDVMITYLLPGELVIARSQLQSLSQKDSFEVYLAINCVFRVLEERHALLQEKINNTHYIHFIEQCRAFLLAGDEAAMRKIDTYVLRHFDPMICRAYIHARLGYFKKWAQEIAESKKYSPKTSARKSIINTKLKVRFNLVTHIIDFIELLFDVLHKPQAGLKYQFSSHVALGMYRYIQGLYDLYQRYNEAKRSPRKALSKQTLQLLHEKMTAEFKRESTLSHHARMIINDPTYSEPALTPGLIN